MSGDSQAVRLPRDFCLKSREVELFRRGDEVVIREPDKTMARALELLQTMPNDVLDNGIDDPPAQERDGL
jgi:antitoxin VapB